MPDRPITQPAVETACAELNAALAGHPRPFEVSQGGRKAQKIDFTAEDAVAMPSDEMASVDRFMKCEIPRKAPEHWPDAGRSRLRGSKRRAYGGRDRAARRHLHRPGIWHHAARRSGRLRVRLLGVDIFRPATGDVVSSEPDDIACWFIDTDYNEEGFFVRHAYFPGAELPYKALRATLKAEIDEEGWESLKRTESRWFRRPASSRIAVKVINHLGDEVMKVIEM